MTERKVEVETEKNCIKTRFEIMGNITIITNKSGRKIYSMSYFDMMFVIFLLNSFL